LNVGAWPGDARGALCLSFDNLGVDEASSAAQGLPGLLKRLGERNLTATFFVEGVNAELDPGALREIGAAGHEVAYHAWRHETWDELTTAEQTENLARGVEAFAALGLEVAGLRPPGGQLGPGGVEVLREAGLSYASPAGSGAGVDDGVAVLPFQWRHVDASCMLPPLGAVRRQMTSSPGPIEPDAFLSYLETEIERLSHKGGFATIVLHLPLLDWLGDSNLASLLNKLSSSDAWLARCDQAAEHVLSSPESFKGGATLDSTSWT
jgi:peptidoglycan/xylan/chitin deacetylase (PgdA/CDA1 family)